MIHRLPPPPAPVATDPERLALLRATAQAVVTRGYANTSARAIVERTGMARSVFYEHFDSRQDAVLAAYDVFVALLAEYTALAIAHVGPTTHREEVRVRIAAVLRLVGAEPELGQLAFLEITDAGPQAVRRYEEALARFGLRAPELVLAGLVALVASTIHRDGIEALDERAESIAGLTIDACRSLARDAPHGPH